MCISDHGLCRPRCTLCGPDSTPCTLLLLSQIESPKAAAQTSPIQSPTPTGAHHDFSDLRPRPSLEVSITRRRSSFALPPVATLSGHGSLRSSGSASDRPTSAGRRGDGDGRAAAAAWPVHDGEGVQAKQEEGHTGESRPYLPSLGMVDEAFRLSSAHASSIGSTGNRASPVGLNRTLTAAGGTIGVPAGVLGGGGSSGGGVGGSGTPRVGGGTPRGPGACLGSLVELRSINEALVTWPGQGDV